jgi:hypothetical protein
MDGQNLLLFGSVVLNLLLFRWGVGEYIRRRKYQKQNGALAEALEAVHHKRGVLVEGQGGAAGWLLAVLLLLGFLVVWWGYF